MRPLMHSAIGLAVALLLCADASAQIGRRFPSERKLVKDPVTGTMLTFLTSKPHGDSKIYPTHPQWTSDGKWLVFRSTLAGSGVCGGGSASCLSSFLSSGPGWGGTYAVAPPLRFLSSSRSTITGES